MSRYECYTHWRFLSNIAMALLISWSVVASTLAADHRDGPRFTGASIGTTGNLDLNDLFVFVSPTNRNNTVLVLTAGGTGVGFVTPPTFAPGCLYQFRIDNNSTGPTDVDEDLVYTCIFSDPDANLRQTVQLFSSTKTGPRTLLAQGTTGRNLPVRGGGTMIASLYDDPFFFDALAFQAFNRVVTRVRGGATELIDSATGLPERVGAFTGIAFPTSPETTINAPRPPNDFFGNTNVLAIVLEIPSIKIQSNSTNRNVKVWITDTLADQTTQFDRMGLPAINPAVIPGGATQNAFNDTHPVNDRTNYRAAAINRLADYFNSPERAAVLADALLPDVMPFNTGNRNGFNNGLTLTLNGRRLQDDVIDAELSLLTNGALTSDRVVNTSIFRRTFPYLGAPLPLPATSRR